MEQLTFGLIITDPQAHRQQAQCKSRKCLSCLEQFPSSGPGNRICGGCRGADRWKAGLSEFSVSNAAF